MTGLLQLLREIPRTNGGRPGTLRQIRGDFTFSRLSHGFESRRERRSIEKLRMLPTMPDVIGQLSVRSASDRFPDVRGSLARLCRHDAVPRRAGDRAGASRTVNRRPTSDVGYRTLTVKSPVGDFERPSCVRPRGCAALALPRAASSFAGHWGAPAPVAPNCRRRIRNDRPEQNRDAAAKALESADGGPRSHQTEDVEECENFAKRGSNREHPKPATRALERAVQPRAEKHGAQSPVERVHDRLIHNEPDRLTSFM